MAGPKQATWAAHRLAGFKAQVADKHPNLEIAAAPHQNFVDPTEGLNTFQDAIQRNPDIKWIYAVDYNLLEAPSLPDKYKGKIPYIAMGLYGSSKQALQDGQVDVIIGLMPGLGGRIGVARAVALLNGDEVPAITVYPAPIYTKSTLNQPAAKFDTFPSSYKP
jgi:ABC-type sugar transport system substrate-binding protein